MYLLTNLGEPDPTKAAILQAGLELLAEKGYKGATTRAIAAKAGISEVTLFRHYKSKEDLMREAINKLEPPADKLLPSFSGDLEADIAQAVANITKFFEANKGFVVRLLPELLRHPELRGDGPATGFAHTFEAGGSFLKHYQELGLLTRHERPEQMILALIGPLIARVLMGGAWGLEMPFDLEAHVKSFLEGRRNE